MAVKSRQESYANKRHQPMEFEVVDHVYLRVSLMKGMKRFGMKGMKRFGMKGRLAPRYMGPFSILEKC
jgi:hypothetical protein